MNKQNMVDMYNRILLFGLNKEGNTIGATTQTKLEDTLLNKPVTV